MAKLTKRNVNEEIIDKIKFERASGKSMAQISEEFEISPQTLYKWAREIPELRQALDDAENMSSQKVLLSATGALMERLRTRVLVEETVTETLDADGVVKKTQKQVKKRAVEPDANLVMFALQRISPEMWDALSVKRLDQKMDASDDYSELLDKIIAGARNGEL